ncbi:DNA binding protein [Aureococcus anophagefferens]|nr:DNA binding protein [Aureococcus anophagefferens]
MTNTYALDSSECYAPTEEGGWGYCGAPTCRNQYITCSDEGRGPPVVAGVAGAYRSDYAADGSDCTSFLDMSDYDEITDWGFNGPCDDTCTQRTDGWLILMTSGEGGVFEPHLNNVPSPPLGVSGGVTYCTGDPTRTVDRYYSLQYPLDVVDFDEGVWTNNVDLFDGTAGNEGIPYLYDDGLGIGTYGLPDGAGVGITVNGMQNWVTQNNRGEWNQPTCETSPCNLHVGQGAGQPHVHGDLFSDSHQCLYGTSNYTSTASHPPIVGFGADGHLIYGRYLGDDAPGFAAPLLDECSGHTHDDSTIDEYGVDLGATYHYHTQIFDYTCGAGNDRCDDGDEVVISTTGPLFCFRADLSRQEGSSALLSFTTSDSYLTANDMTYACCDMTDYYAVTGLDQKDASQFFAESSTCLVLAHPTNGAYASAFCEPGDTLYSGNGCHVDCDDGYVASGVTRCVEGAFVECAACVEDARVGRPTPGAGRRRRRRGRRGIGSLLILVGVACVVVACGVCYAAFYLHRRERRGGGCAGALEGDVLEAADAGEAPPALPAPVDAGCAPGRPAPRRPRVERATSGRGDRLAPARAAYDGGEDARDGRAPFHPSPVRGADAPPPPPSSEKKKKKKKKKKKDAPAPEPAWELTEDRDDAPFVL